MKHLKYFENIESKFDVDDYVVCIDNIGAYLLKMGNIYQISNVHVNEFTKDVFYNFNEISNSSGWSENRFRKATDEEVSMKKYNL